MSDRMLLIAGPCVIEDEALVQEIAQELKHQLTGLPLDLVFKASFDKANRTSIDGFRGPGMEEGLKILTRVREKTGLPVLTDFHTPEQAEPVARAMDFIQIPAFLCRQTDIILAGAEAALKYGRRLNVKKGQFLAPWDAKNIAGKIHEVEAKHLKNGCKLPAQSPWWYLTERGVSFGYNNLVVDMRSFQAMQSFGAKVIYDATHSIQIPGAAPGGKSTGGQREYLEILARSAVAAGADAIFMEVHPRPAQAKSDGPNAFYLEHAGAFVKQLLKIREVTRPLPRLLPEAQSMLKA